MTIIVYRDGKIAADSGVSNGDNTFASMTKIARNNAGDLVGAGGDAGFAYQFLEWFKDGENGKHPLLRDIQSERVYDKAAIFRASGIWEIFEPPGKHIVRGPYYAFGSGKPEALGALWMGATAEQAVAAAISLDNGCWGDIIVLTHVG